MEAQAARTIRVFLCDSDGVLFPNTVLMGAPYKAKYRSYYDGQGLSLLRAVGIRVAFITNERGEAAAALRETIEKLNSLLSSQSETNPGGWPPIELFEGYGSERKIEAAETFLQHCGASFAEAAYMGDDLVDVPLLKKVALPCAPAQAEKAVRALCAFVAEREGGAGAIRDFANFVLAARGVDPFSLPPQ